MSELSCLPVLWNLVAKKTPLLYGKPLRTVPFLYRDTRDKKYSISLGKPNSRKRPSPFFCPSPAQQTGERGVTLPSSSSSFPTSNPGSPLCIIGLSNLRRPFLRTKSTPLEFESRPPCPIFFSCPFCPFFYPIFLPAVRGGCPCERRPG